MRAAAGKFRPCSRKHPDHWRLQLDPRTLTHARFFAPLLAPLLARQLAHPQGIAGRALGKAMDFANRRPTRSAIDRLAPQGGERIIDAGCGTGAAIALLHKRAACRAVGIDPSAAMLASARARLGADADVHLASLGSLPFADATFDAALALNMLYFCDEGGAMLGDLRRVLRPGGRLVAYVTHRATMERWPFASAGYHRLFDAGELALAFQQGGFASSSIVIEERAMTRSVRGLFAMVVK